MTADELTCSYCNAVQPNRPGLAVGQRVTCVRCGESFRVTSVAATTTSAQAASAPFPTEAEPRPAGVRGRNRLVAGAVLAGMVVMSGIGLTYALMSQDFRRKNDTSLPRKTRKLFPGQGEPAPAPEGPLPPARLDGLAYLPTATNVLAAADVRSLRNHPQWAEVRQMRLGAGPAALTLAQLPAWTGLEEGEIDQVVVGVTLSATEPRELTPPVTIVVRSAGDHDAAKVRKALKATKPVTAASADGVRRELYRAKLGTVPVTLWHADARTVVLGLFDLNLKQVPGRPHEGAARLPSEVRDAMDRRLTGAPPVWAVGHSSDWNKTVVPTLLATMKDAPLGDQLGKVRTLALALTPGKPAKLLLQVEAADEAAAKGIEAKVLAPRAKANPKGMKYARDAAWLSVQMDVELRASGG